MKQNVKNGISEGVKGLRDVTAKSRGFIGEFKEFISRGNVIDLAVGVIIGGAFGKIVSSLVDNVIMPLVGVLLGGHDFTGLAFTVGSARVTYGVFIQNIIDFLIVAACVFIFIKLINKLNRKDKPEAVEEADPQTTDEEILEVLKGIRATIETGKNAST